MLNFFIFLFVFILLVEASVELVVKSKFFSFLRNFFKRRKQKKVCKFIYEAISCPYCFSVWISLFYTLLLVISVYISGVDFELTEVFIVDSFIFVILVHRLSNHFHNFCDKYLDKVYSPADFGGKEKNG